MDEKFDQLMQPVTLTTPIYSLLDGYLAPAAGVLEGQQASDGLGNQAGTELYPESQQVGTGDPTNTGELDNLLDSSAETLPLVPKTPDTSFESKQQGAGSVVGQLRQMPGLSQAKGNSQTRGVLGRRGIAFPQKSGNKKTQ